jgi:hypothetical protein
VSVALDFNRSNLSDRPISELINELIEHAEPASENYRQYLGASAIGSECLRKIQFDWMCDPKFPGRIKDIFARGHFFEDVTRQHLIAAGFKFAPPERLEFRAAEGMFRVTPMGSLLRVRSCRAFAIHASGSTNALVPKVGKQSSAMA